MIEMTDEEVREFKRSYKKQYGVNYTDEQVRKANHNLVGFFQLFIDIDCPNQKKNSEMQGGARNT